MRPGWCPFPTCQWITGGGCADDSGSFCFGELPSQSTHFGTVNTHRLCCRTADNHVDNWELNRSDVWYTKRFLSNVLRILDTTSKAGEVGCQALSPDTPERGEGGAMTIHGLPVKIDPTLPPGAWYIETEDGQRIHPPPDAGGEGV